nr:SIP domain-containing protein [Angustibacter aerolatus]
MAASAEALPAGVHARVLVEVAGSDDEVEVTAPSGVRVTWLHRGARPVGEALVAAVRDAGPLPGRGQAFVHGEAAFVREPAPRAAHRLGPAARPVVGVGLLAARRRRRGLARGQAGVERAGRGRRPRRRARRRLSAAPGGLRRASPVRRPQDVSGAGRWADVPEPTDAMPPAGPPSVDLVFDATPMGMAIVSAEGVYQRVNRAYAAMIGRLPEQMVGRRRRDFNTDRQVVADVSEPGPRARPARGRGAAREGVPAPRRLPRAGAGSRCRWCGRRGRSRCCSCRRRRSGRSRRPSGACARCTRRTTAWSPSTPSAASWGGTSGPSACSACRPPR